MKHSHTKRKSRRAPFQSIESPNPRSELRQHVASLEQQYPAPPSIESQPYLAIPPPAVSSWASNQGSTVPSYTALTPHVLRQHEHNQASSCHGLELEYLHVDQAKHIEVALDTFGVHLEHMMRAKFHQEPVGMLPMERFQGSLTQPFHTSAYEGQSFALNDIVDIQTPSQEYTYGVSSIFANAGEDNMTYAQYNSADTLVFAPEPPYHVPGAGSAYDVTAAEYDLAAVGSHFATDPYWDHTTLSYTNGRLE